MCRNFVNDVPGEPQLLQGTNAPVSQIDLPPAVAVSGHALVSMVIIVPTFAERQHADPPEIGAVVGGFIVAIAPDMRCRVYEPRDMEHINHPQKHSPKQE